MIRNELENMKLKLDLNEVKGNPWNLENVPISIKIRGVRIPSWQIEKGSAGRIPLVLQPVQGGDNNIEEITLIPYGCTTLRISQFPVINLGK